MTTTIFTVNEKQYEVSGLYVSGHAGSYTVQGIINNEMYKAFTHNASIKDDFNESDDYFESDNSGHWYSSREAVDQAMVELLVKANEL